MLTENQPDQLLHTARQSLLGDGYGKFDYVEMMVAPDFLLSEKPRVIRKHIASLLQLEIDQISYVTFMGWLYRYRKRGHTNTKTSNNLLTQNLPEDAAWKNFTPSEPVKNEDYNKAILVYPYKK
jgi:hypothetical protein